MNEVEITKEQRQEIISALNRFGEQMTELACVFHAKIEKLSPYIELLASLEPAAPQQKKRKKSKWHPADERPMRSESFPHYSVDVVGEANGKLHVVFWNEAVGSWKSSYLNPGMHIAIDRWRHLKKCERIDRNWQGEPWPDEGGEE